MKKIVAFSKDEKNISKFQQLGASFFGGSDLIERIASKEIIPRADFTFAVATPDIVPELYEIRIPLGDMFPTTEKQTISVDVNVSMNVALHGISFESYKISDAIGRLELPIGTLDMPVSDLETNFNALIEMINKRKYALARPGASIIAHVGIACHPSPEVFLIEQEAAAKSNKARDTAEK